jgi:uncharacterized protein DUF1592/uncharacterized protein DUF1588/uncharacterized protein DUF1587/uncharacterized protein DUF1595/uncharacterized protein DUF1585
VSTLVWIGILATLSLHAQIDFARDLYPALERAQCRLCHNDNGVASTTRLQFPREGATPEEVSGFGLRLRVLVDASVPEQSPLFLRPTNRVQHPGGERIKQGSPDEQKLLAWIRHLGGLRTLQLSSAAVKLGPSRPALRRLTHSQYNHTVRDLLKEETRPADSFPKEDFVHGFTNQAEGQSISPLLAEAYSRAAERLSRNAFRGGDGRRLIPCAPSDACRAQFIRQFGNRAFRRPLADDEISRYEQLFANENDFLKGAALVVEAMLQSPHFLFHLEPGGYAVASRLSYFLWDTMPDPALLKAAESGELHEAAGIEKQVRRMLADDRARAALDEFLAQWLRFDRLRNAIRDRRIFPEFNAELVNAMIGETTRLFRSLVWQDRDFREFFTADYTHLSPELARIYNLPPPAESWMRVSFEPNSPRSGILGQSLFLALTSKPADTSPTERGHFIREHFLCQQVPPPPPGVNTTLPAVTDEKPQSTRDRLQIHLSNQACSACHGLIDPIGFGLERFDAIGRYREKETVVIYPTFDEMKTRRKVKPTTYELAIEARGSVRGLKEAEFGSPRELGAILAREPSCQKCIVKQLFRYAVGRPETPEDAPVIEQAFARFRDSRFQFQALIMALATSETFR